MSSNERRPTHGVRLSRRATDACREVVGRLHRGLPRGIGHLGVQLLVWCAFYLAYHVTRGFADRNVSAAFDNGEWIARTEARMGALFEPSLQHAVESSLMTSLMSSTYWLSQFVVLFAALFWVYVRHYAHFAFLRNWLIVANVTGLVCYVLVPTAPPRMLPEWGFTDTLSESAIDHGSVASLANPYAAMPSLHVMDALIIGAALFMVTKRQAVKLLWLLWPAWVAFAVLASGNHYWLDIAAGMAIALLSALALRSAPVLRRVSGTSDQRPMPVEAPDAAV